MGSRSRRKKIAPLRRSYHQCDECHTTCYSVARQQEVARLEFEAIGAGTVYVCDDFKAHWLRAMNES